MSAPSTIRHSREEYIAMLEKHNWMKKPAAREMGIEVTTFGRHLAKLGITAPTGLTPSQAGLSKALHEQFGSAATPAAASPGKAVDLTKVRTASKKPLESVKSKLYQLPRGKGFPLADAAREWGVSAETLRRHAKDVGAFVYAEVAPEQWVEVVKHPDR
jgi:hypothetical protein